MVVKNGETIVDKDLKIDLNSKTEGILEDQMTGNVVDHLVSKFHLPNVPSYLPSIEKRYVFAFVNSDQI